MKESIKALVVDGQIVQPKWAWSPEYRAAVRETLKEHKRQTAGELEDAEAEYIRNWAARRGLPCECDDDLETVRALILETQR